MVLCEWFALCMNPAWILVKHVAFPKGVPTCHRCAERFNLTGVEL